MIRPPPSSTRADTLVPYTTLFRSQLVRRDLQRRGGVAQQHLLVLDVTARRLADHLLDATHARRQRLLAGHLEEADVAGAPHVGAAAEPGRIGLAATRGIAAAHRQHAHLVAVLLADRKSTRLNSSH